MNLLISNSSDLPIYEQIKRQIIKEIANQNLASNEILPSVRSLAKDLQISVLTVKKAYDALEEAGYIKTVQGKGSYVSAKNLELIKEEQLKMIEQHLLEAIQIAKLANISKNEIGEVFDYLYEEEEHEK